MACKPVEFQVTRLAKTLPASGDDGVQTRFGIRDIFHDWQMVGNEECAARGQKRPGDIPNVLSAISIFGQSLRGA